MRSSRSSHNVDQENRRSDYQYHASNRSQTHLESNGHTSNSADYRSKRSSISTASNLIKRMKSSSTNSNENSTSARDHVNSKTSKIQNNSHANSINIDPNECHQLNHDGYVQEEAEALSGDSLLEKSARDFEKFSLIASNLKELVKKILEHKKGKSQQKIDNKKSTNKSIETSAEAKIQGLMYLMEMKNLNRLEKHRLKEARKRINLAKDNVDQIHLQLQNFQYEVMHLQKEQKTCASFRSKDESLDLVELEKFLISDHFPEDLRHLLIHSSNGKTVLLNKEIAKSEELHKLHLARLEWELKQRILSDSRLKMTQESRFRLEVEITTKKRTLSKFGPTLKNIIESAAPLVSELEVPLQVYDENNLLTSFLPQSLYVLYIQLCAYKTAFELKYEVNIEGTVDEAKEFELRQKQEAATYFLRSNKTDDDDDIGQPIDEDEDETEKRRKKSKKSRFHSSHHQQPNNDHSDGSDLTPGKDDSVRKYNDLLQNHPLKINLIFRYNSYEIMCTFKFYPKLELVGLDYKVENKSTFDREEMKFSVTDYASNIFSKLIAPDDTGNKCPNVMIEYLLRKYGIMKYSELIPELGYTYDWAQRMAGFEYLHPDKKPILSSSGTIRVRSSIAMDCLDKTVRLMNLRFQSRIHLEKQLHEIYSRKHEIYSRKHIIIQKFTNSIGGEESDEQALNTSTKIKSHIESLTKITPDQLIDEIDIPKKNDLMDYFESEDPDSLCNDLFDENNFMFKLIISNQSSETISYTFHAFIVIPHNYPFRWPFFIITFARESEKRPSFLHRKWIRSLEEHINVDLPQKIIQVQPLTDDESNEASETLLLRQVYELQYGLDVITEAYEKYIQKANDENVEVYSGPRSVGSLLSTSIVQGHDHSLKFT